ncbi:MAG: 16S rRNA (cytidine(1402)-2'-O)-methyltransferase [Chloroflexi bacterium]|nr:16S rRNA (cytidine(1402)-2'-O)-methyltransferase [Chloroflexota bacterium]
MLYLVATPIGNLGDISLRAIETLRQVDWVASEDTRKTGMMLKHFQISKPQVAFYAHNEDTACARIIGLLKSGLSVALVTNAGTPGISDPGFSLVRSALAENIPITMIPGATALVMALVLSGLPTHSFTFRGFPPHTTGARRHFYEADLAHPYTLIYYESPYRLLASLQDALLVFGPRRAAVANDLTKLFERVYRGTLAELVEQLPATPLKGEYVIVIAGGEKS